jgi:hypothetical protein
MDTNRHEFSARALVFISVNGADGISDIEGKVARVSDEGDGKRPSFKLVVRFGKSSSRLAAETDTPAACAPRNV